MGSPSLCLTVSCGQPPPSAGPPTPGPGCIQQQLLDDRHGAYLIGRRRVSPRIPAPLCPRSVPGLRHSWRPSPPGSAAARRARGRSSRPVTTKATWRSEDRKKRWVFFTAARVPVRACWSERGHPAELSTSLLCWNGRGGKPLAAGGFVRARASYMYRLIVRLCQACTHRVHDAFMSRS